MTRRPSRPIDGILLLDKPVGLTSNAALQRVKKTFLAEKAGHTGSLDELASGLLPICLGEATKVSGYLLDARKRYRTTVMLGVRTDTGDANGAVIERRPVPLLGPEIIEVALAGLRGPQLQVPPMYSALKRGGQPLYRLARRGIAVDREPRPIVIHALTLVAWRGEELDLDVLCSKGTYVRSLAEDLGTALECGAHVTALRRTEVADFDLTQAIDLATLAHLATAAPAAIDARLLPIDAALTHQPAVALGAEAAWSLTRGQTVSVPQAPPAGLVRLYDAGQRFLGIGEILPDARVAPRRLLRCDLRPPAPASVVEPGDAR